MVGNSNIVSPKNIYFRGILVSRIKFNIFTTNKITYQQNLYIELTLKFQEQITSNTSSLTF